MFISLLSQNGARLTWTKCFDPRISSVENLELVQRVAVCVLAELCRQTNRAHELSCDGIQPNMLDESCKCHLCSWGLQLSTVLVRSRWRDFLNRLVLTSKLSSNVSLVSFDRNIAVEKTLMQPVDRLFDQARLELFYKLALADSWKMCLIYMTFNTS